MNAPRTFPDLLALRLRSDAGQPLVTAYDDDSGERTELSVTTYANWVSKTANLFTEELDLEAGDTVLLDLPAHWLVPVFLGAAWTAGLTVTTDAAVPHDLVVCGPSGIATHAARATRERVLACSLRPFAVRFAEPLPPSVHDYGLSWPGQSDVFLSIDPVTPDSVAWTSRAGSLTQAELLDLAERDDSRPGVRLLTDAHPALEQGVPVVLSPLLRGGSVVLLTGTGPEGWAARRESERATAELRVQPATE